MRKLVAVVGLVLGLVAVPPAAAQVATPAACEDRELRGAQCATVPVPLDHADPLSTTIPLAYARFPAQGPSRGTVVFLAGGPGQAALPVAGAAARGELRGLRRAYDLVFVDQRGTGRSAPLRCSTAPRGVFTISPNATPAEAAAVVSTCANELGDARRHFTTYATARDLELLRTALGVPQIVPLGVSYGGQVAGEYARRFPGQTQALVLDSTGPIEGGDLLGALPQLALPRVLRETCFPPGCDRILGEPRALLAGAIERIGEAGLAGRVVTPSGRKRSGRITVADVYTLVRASDLDPALRTALPAALEAAGRGDAAPLLRLAVSGPDVEQPADEAINEVRLLATDCVEGRLPWTPESDPATRPALLLEALRADAGRYAPFPVDVVATRLTATLCAGWPATPEPPQAASNGPDLPVLILGGRMDLRTPLEDQRRAGLQFPRAQVVGVPNVGHSVLGSEIAGCGRDALEAFLLGRARRACPNVRLVPLALPVFRDLDDLPGARGDLPRRIEQTAVAVDLTLRDVGRQLAAFAVGASSTAEDVRRRSVRLGGLRGGRLELTETSVVLRAYELVPGVRVTGRLSTRGTGTLTVTGTGAEGTLAVSRTGTLRGTLDGRAIRYRPLAVTSEGR
jgi:pimeloyl-ACP methyl ester carboxylesterase